MHLDKPHESEKASRAVTHCGINFSNNGKTGFKVQPYRSGVVASLTGQNVGAVRRLLFFHRKLSRAKAGKQSSPYPCTTSYSRATLCQILSNRFAASNGGKKWYARELHNSVRPSGDN